MLRKVPAVIDNMGVVKMRIIATFCIVAFYVAPTDLLMHPLIG